MNRDPLDAVARIRRVAVDSAHRDLAESLNRETDAGEAARAADARIAAEGAHAASLDTGDSAVEAYGRWLPIGRAAAKRARAAHDAALATVTFDRAVLAAARAGAEAADLLLAGRAAARAALAETRAQQALDEIAGRPHKP